VSLGGLRNNVKTAGRQIELVVSRHADVVALQEVRLSAWDKWRSALRADGFTHFAHAADASSAAGIPLKKERGVAVASRVPFSFTGLPGVPFSELALACSFATRQGPLDLINTHMPNGSDPKHGDLKLNAFDAVYDACAIEGRTRVLCGDFNSPVLETEDGYIKCSSTPGDDWFGREWLVMAGLKHFGMVDSFRTFHGYSVPAHSHAKPQYGEDWVRRFDHVFTSTDLEVEGCRYHTSWMDQGASDHAPIEVDLARNLLTRSGTAPGKPNLGAPGTASIRPWVRGHDWVPGVRYLLEVVPHNELFDPNGWDYVVRCRDEHEANDRQLHERRFHRCLVDTGAVEEEAEVAFQWLNGPSTAT
jgi:exonuclease III